METTVLGLNSTDISLIQLLTTFVGGVFALYLFFISNKEKRKANEEKMIANEEKRIANIEKKKVFLLSIYEKLFEDDEIRAVIYATDKNLGLDELKEKAEGNRIGIAKLEKETDKTLMYFEFIAQLVNDNLLSLIDLTPFRYELHEVLTNKVILAYKSYQERIKVSFDNLNWLLIEIEKHKFFPTKSDSESIAL